MKVVPARIGAVLRERDAAVLLIYGEDAGLVRDRANQAIQAAMVGGAAPFQLCTLLREEHGKLRDEALSLPLDGSRRIVRVLEAGDGLVPALLKLPQGRGAALVVLEAGALLPRSKLRTTAEQEAGWACVACYPMSVAAIAAEIRQSLAEAGLEAADQVVPYLATTLSGDSSQRRQEMEKLALYAAGTGQVEIADVVACCAVENESALPDLFSAAMLGRMTAVDEQLAVAEWDGATGPGLLAGFAGHVHRLLRVRAAMDGGLSGEAAGRAQRPPIYPRQLDSMLRQVGLWPARDLLQLSAAVSTADAACKRTATRDFTIAAKVILDAARHAGRRAGSAT